MKNIQLKKQKKRTALLDSAYGLFTTIGFQKTTITNIVDNAGVAKGTFYLYFKDKEDIRKALVLRRSSEILNEAVDALNRQPHVSQLDFSDRIIYITNYILDFLSTDIAQLQFVSKYLSGGILTNKELAYSKDDEALNFRQFIQRTLQKGGIELERIHLVVYTILELINSTCYNIILHGNPVTIGEYKPYLYRCIRVLIEDALNTSAGGTLS